jgi:hypothetical protein
MNSDGVMEVSMAAEPRGYRRRHEASTSQAPRARPSRPHRSARARPARPH